MKDFIEVTRYTYPHEYAVLKNLLEKARIPFFFKNETMVTTAPFYSNALGGIILLVHKDFKEQTLNIIDQLNSNLSIVS